MVVRFALASKVAIRVAVRSRIQAHQTHHLKVTHTSSKLVNFPYRPSAELAIDPHP